MFGEFRPPDENDPEVRRLRQAHQAADFLLDPGIATLARLPQDRLPDVMQGLIAANATVSTFMALNPGRTIWPVAKKYHHFEIVQAASLPEVRGMLGKYDDLYRQSPNLLPGDLEQRKSMLLDRWFAFKALRQAAHRGATYAADVGGRECQLPPGLQLRFGSMTPGWVRYDDPAHMLNDVARYDADYSVSKNPPKSEDSWDRRWSGEFFHQEDDNGGHYVTPLRNGFDYNLGVYSIERYAHIAGQIPRYTKFTAVMDGSVGVAPQEDVVRLLVAVTGRDEVERLRPGFPKAQHPTHFEFPTGRLDFSGLDPLQGLITKAEDGDTPRAFATHLQFPGLPDKEVAEVAHRFSAWRRLYATEPKLGFAP